MAAAALAVKRSRVIVFSSIETLVGSLAESADVHGLPLSFHAGAVHQTDADAATSTKLSSPSADYSDALIAVADPPLIPQIYALMPQVRWVQSTWAGVDGLFKSLAANTPSSAEASTGSTQHSADDTGQICPAHSNAILCSAACGDTPPPFTLTRCGGQFGSLMAEYVLGHTIAWVRQFAAGDKAQSASTWSADALRHILPLSQLTLGVLGGGGGIAASVLAAAKLGFGMRTVAYVSSARAVPHADAVVDSVQACLGQCDVVVNLLPSTPATRGLLDGDVFEASTARREHNIKGGLPEHLWAPLFINAGRGDVVSEKAVVKALDAGWIGHAVLDVFQQEPLPTSSVLWLHPRVTVSPHVAAVSLPQDVAEAFSANAKAFLGEEKVQHGEVGEPMGKMKWVVDWSRGY